MEFRDVVRRRRMVRNYAQRPIESAVLERIAATAQRAPSAGFSQGVRLVVVTDAQRRQALAEACDEAAYLARGFDPWLSRAPALIVPCVSEEAYRRRYREPDKRAAGEPEKEWPVPYWWVDAGSSLLLILLAAVDEGLAAGFLGPRDLPAVREVLGIPADYVPLGVVSLGHAAPDRRSGSLDRGRVPEREFIRWESW
ncbi:MAG TPA: nitroreductase family protein [Candidatus Limnocylindria bacterium]|nr:nitroreductase family protein [Candidatus Limnocylindria bacterium]